MLRIQADVNVTRRQRLHYVFDKDEQLQWSGAHVRSLFEWLYENGHLQVELETENNLLQLEIKRIAE